MQGNVILHRSEGYGRVPAEGIALGIPSILTAYSGVMDYASDNNSYLLPFDLVSVKETGGYHTYTYESLWAEPCKRSAASAILSTIRQDEKYLSISSRIKSSYFGSPYTTGFNQLKNLLSMLPHEKASLFDISLGIYYTWWW